MKSTAKHESRTRPASYAKSHWRDIVDEVNANGEVVVTNYNRPAVVVVSMAQYAKLKKDATAHDPLASLRDEFDRDLAALRQANTSEKLRKVLAATPADIAKAANAGRHRRT
jgi:prevent-host-death family protein